MHPCPTLTVLAAGQVAELPLSLSGSASVLGFTSLPRVFANASGRIEFIIFLIMDWSFASGCSPPRLSATQLPSATDSQCSVRWGLPPHCWCALSGARGRPLRRRRETVSIYGRQRLRGTAALQVATDHRCHQLMVIAGRLLEGVRSLGAVKWWPFRAGKRLRGTAALQVSIDHCCHQ